MSKGFDASLFDTRFRRNNEPVEEKSDNEKFLEAAEKENDKRSEFSFCAKTEKARRFCRELKNHPMYNITYYCQVRYSIKIFSMGDYFSYDNVTYDNKKRFIAEEENYKKFVKMFSELSPVTDYEKVYHYNIDVFDFCKKGELSTFDLYDTKSNIFKFLSNEKFKNYSFFVWVNNEDSFDISKYLYENKICNFSKVLNRLPDRVTSFLCDFTEERQIKHFFEEGY